MSGGDTYALLSRGITRSSLWGEALAARVAMISLISLADKDGCVWGSDAMLARDCGLTRDEWAEAWQVLSSPDEDSTSTTEEGRRLVRIERDGRRGVRLVTHDEWLLRWSRASKREADAERQARLRTRKQQVSGQVSQPESDASQSECDTSRPVTEVTPNHTRPYQTKPNHTQTPPTPSEGAPACELEPPTSKTQPRATEPESLQDLAVSALDAEHEWTFNRPDLVPAIETMWEGWRAFTGKPQDPVPRTLKATRPLLEALANGRDPAEVRRLLTTAHSKCWARGKGLGAAFNNLDSLGSPDEPKRSAGGPTAADGSAWVHQNQHGLTADGQPANPHIRDLFAAGRAKGRALGGGA